MLPLAFLAQVWLVGAGVLIVNQLRTLAAHGYENAGVPVDTQGQQGPMSDEAAVTLLNVVSFKE